MKRTSLMVSALLAAAWVSGCGDDGGGDPADTPDASTSDTEDGASDTDSTDTDTDDDTDSTDTEDTDTVGTDTVGTDTDTEGGDTDDDTDSSDTDDEELPDGGVPGDAGAGQLIGAAGGIVSNAAGVVLEVPPNSISTPSEITIDELAADDRVISSIWDFQPDGLTFDPPALLTLPYDAANASDTVVIAWLDHDVWVPLDECVVDAPYVTCLVEHFTAFGVLDLDEPSDEEGGVTDTDEPDTDTEESDTEESDTDTEESDTEESDTEEPDTEESDTDVGGECNLPPCVALIDFESCQPDVAETCQTETAGGQIPLPTAVNICYANGVKARIAPLLTEPRVVNFKTAAGAACYSIEITGTQTINYTWKTPGGSPVMTGTVQISNPNVVTFQCDGQSYVVDFGDEACSASGSRPPDTDTEGCTQGTCSF